MLLRHVAPFVAPGVTDSPYRLHTIQELANAFEKPRGRVPHRAPERAIEAMFGAQGFGSRVDEPGRGLKCSATAARPQWVRGHSRIADEGEAGHDSATR